MDHLFRPAVDGSRFIASWFYVRIFLSDYQFRLYTTRRVRSGFSSPLDYLPRDQSHLFLIPDRRTMFGNKGAIFNPVVAISKPTVSDEFRKRFKMSLPLVTLPSSAQADICIGPDGRGVDRFGDAS
jgi:hypothetical protein